MAVTTNNKPHDYDPDRVRANVRRTVWICVAVIAVMVALFLAEHL